MICDLFESHAQHHISRMAGVCRKRRTRLDPSATSRLAAEEKREILKEINFQSIEGLLMQHSLCARLEEHCKKERESRPGLNGSSYKLYEKDALDLCRRKQVAEGHVSIAML